jgi:hypothetical protein
MDTLIVAFFVMLGLVTAMAVGVIFGRKPIAGSCGGMKALGMEMDCEVCGGDPECCEKSPFVSSPAASQSQDDLAQRVGK